jgi:esterase/lipase
LTYSDSKSYSPKVEISQYGGLNGLDPPVKIITPLKYRKKVIILYPGASPYAEEHPTMGMLGIVLAQNGYKVFIPRIPPLKILDISAVNVEWFICFYQWLLDVHKLESHNIAMVGISYGGGIMLKAYLQLKEFVTPPKILMTHGTYADAESTLRFLLTGAISNHGVQYTITPHAWGLIVIFQNYLKNLELDWDTTGVQEVMGLEIQARFDDRDNVINKLPKFQQNIVSSVLSGKGTAEVMALCQAMIQNEIETLQDLSPKYWCHKIHQKVFIFHGANDSMIPFTESIQLAESIPNSELLISFIYEHKEISTDRGMYYKLKEYMRMLQFFSKFYYYNEN